MGSCFAARLFTSIKRTPEFTSSASISFSFTVTNPSLCFYERNPRTKKRNLFLHVNVCKYLYIFAFVEPGYDIGMVMQIKLWYMCIKRDLSAIQIFKCNHHVWVRVILLFYEHSQSNHNWVHANKHVFCTWCFMIDSLVVSCTTLVHVSVLYLSEKHYEVLLHSIRTAVS